MGPLRRSRIRVVFAVTTSSNKGFIRASATDSRYFEYDDGTYFPALGYNMNYERVGWFNPVADNKTNFETIEKQ